MADPLTQTISMVAPNLMLLIIIFIPLVIVGMLALIFIVSRFQVWAIVEYGYESKNDIRTYKVNYSRDRSFLVKAGIPGLDPGAGFPIPVSGSPIRNRGKPAYRFYSPEPGIFIPVSLALDRQIIVGFEKDEAGEFVLDDNKQKIPITRMIADLIPKIGFEARQAFGESYSEAEKLYSARNKLMQMLATWAPIIVFVVLMLVVIVMLGNLISNLNQGVTVVCTADAALKGATASAPFFS